MSRPVPVFSTVLRSRFRPHLLQEAFPDFLALPRCPLSSPHLQSRPCALLSHGVFICMCYLLVGFCGTAGSVGARPRVTAFALPVREGEKEGVRGALGVERE